MIEKEQKCPICGNKINKDYKPFCSQRCQDADLWNWLEEIYIIPKDIEN